MHICKNRTGFVGGSHMDPVCFFSSTSLRKKSRKKSQVFASLAFRQQMCISWVVNVRNQYMIPIYFYKEIERSYLCLDTLFYGLHEFCWRQNHFSHSFFHLVFSGVPTSSHPIVNLQIADRIFQTKCLTFAYIWQRWRRFFLWTSKQNWRKTNTNGVDFGPPLLRCWCRTLNYTLFKAMLKCVYIKHSPNGARLSIIEKKTNN